MDIMPEEVSKFVFSPDGESLYIYKKNFDSLKHSYDKKQNDFTALIKEHSIEPYSLLPVKGSIAIYDECIAATTRDTKKLVYDVASADPDLFIYDFMDEIYRVHYVEGKKDSTPYKSNTVAGLAAQRNDMQNIDSKGGSQDSVENLDCKLYEKLYALIEDNGDYDRRDILLTYARLKKMMANQTDRKNKNFFNGLERASTELDFIGSDFFKGSEADNNVTRLWCILNYHRYSMVDSPVFMYRCLDCKREFSSLMYDTCPMCGSDRRIISSVLNGKYATIGQPFVEELGNMVKKLVAGADVDIDGYVNMLPDERYEFYETYFKETIESLDTKLTDEFIKPLDELETAIDGGSYSDERYERLKSLTDKYGELPDIKKKRLDKDDFGTRSALLLQRYSAEHDRIKAEEFQNKAQAVLAGEPSRDDLEGLRDGFSAMDTNIAMMVRMTGLDKKIEDAITNMNLAESSRCLDSITSALAGFDFTDLDDAKRRLDSAHSAISSLHPDSLAKFNLTAGPQLVEDFDGKLQYQLSLRELRPLMSDVDLVYGMSVDDMVSVFDGIYGKFSVAHANPRFTGILDSQGYSDKMSDMQKRVSRYKAEKADFKVQTMLAEVTHTDLDTDSEVIDRVERLISGLPEEVLAVFREGSVYRDYVTARNDVQKRRDEADAFRFNSEMTALEGIEDLKKFEDMYTGLKEKLDTFNAAVNEIIRSQYDLDYRMAELERRFGRMKVEEYTDGFISRLGSMRESFDEVTPEQMDAIVKEMESMSPEASDSFYMKAGDAGRAVISSMSEAKKSMSKACSDIDSLLARDFGPDMYGDIRNANVSVASIPETYRDRFTGSARSKAYRDMLAAYGQWQLTHMVKEIGTRTDAVGSGDSDYFKENPEVRRLYDGLMPAVKGLPEVVELMERFDSLKGSRIDRTKELAKIVADCESDYSEENIRRFNECCSKMTDSEKGIENVRALKNRFDNAEAAYWGKASRKITKAVDGNYGLFNKKITADDMADINEAYALYESMPEKYSSMIEKSKVKKLIKLHGKI